MRIAAAQTQGKGPDVTTAPPATYRAVLAGAVGQRRSTLDASLAALHADVATLAEVASLLVGTLREGRKVLVAGNGGSAAEAQHFAAELLGRFRRERAPFAVLSLTADSATLTAIANDYGYAEVFARQVHGLGQRGDALVLFSTSGESPNMVRAAQAARVAGLSIVALTGPHPCRLARAADLTVAAGRGVPDADTALVQELHMVVTHLLCDLVEAELTADPGATVGGTHG